MNGYPALFLDRDGVINVDHGYVCRPEEFEFVDGIFDLCRSAQGLGYLLIVITNQAGIGRGYYSVADFRHLTDWMRDAFCREGITIDGVYFCPYHPEHGIGIFKAESPCRKPAPGMLLQAAKEHDIDLNRSALIGDKESDIQAGMAAGVGVNMLLSHEPQANQSVVAISSLLEAIPILSVSIHGGTRFLMDSPN